MSAKSRQSDHASRDASRRPGAPRRAPPPGAALASTITARRNPAATSGSRTSTARCRLSATTTPTATYSASATQVCEVTGCIGAAAPDPRPPEAGRYGPLPHVPMVTYDLSQVHLTEDGHARELQTQILARDGIRAEAEAKRYAAIRARQIGTSISWTLTDRGRLAAHGIVEADEGPGNREAYRPSRPKFARALPARAIHTERQRQRGHPMTIYYTAEEAEAAAIQQYDDRGREGQADGQAPGSADRRGRHRARHLGLDHGDHGGAGGRRADGRLPAPHGRGFGRRGRGRGRGRDRDRRARVASRNAARVTDWRRLGRVRRRPAE